LPTIQRFSSSRLTRRPPAQWCYASADLPDSWKGDLVKPDLEGFSCPGYTQSDLVVTGAASSQFGSGQVQTTVWVMKTAEMVRLDEKRLSPIELQCTRRGYEEAASASAGAIRLVSVSRLTGFPRVAPYTRATRVVYDQKADGQTTRLFDDLIDLSRGRIEVGLSLTAPYADRGAVKRFEVALAKLLAGRATPPKIIGFLIPANALLGAKSGRTYTFGGIRLKLDKLDGIDNTGVISTLLAPDTLACEATLVGQPLRGTGKGGCRWQLPDTAKGKQLVVVATVTLQGATAKHKVRLKVE
jgi:hypothetical protein